MTLPAEVDLESYTADEIMAVEAARALYAKRSCFVGIGLPSTAANLARNTHSPDLVLVYESGCIGSKPESLPSSIGDGILADTAMVVVSVPEIFNYWLQPGRIQVGFLSAAEVDQRGNINTTVIGDYANPVVRLPGSGGAPEIAAHCDEVVIIVRHTRQTFVERVGFVSSLGFGSGPDDRKRAGYRGGGPQLVITDLGVLRPDPDGVLALTALHPGITVEQVREATGWDLRIAPDLGRTAPPTPAELAVLRRLQASKTERS